MKSVPRRQLLITAPKKQILVDQQQSTKGCYCLVALAMLMGKTMHLLIIWGSFAWVPSLYLSRSQLLSSFGSFFRIFTCASTGSFLIVVTALLASLRISSSHHEYPAISNSKLAIIKGVNAEIIRMFVMILTFAWGQTHTHTHSQFTADTLIRIIGIKEGGNYAQVRSAFCDCEITTRSSPIVYFARILPCCSSGI